MPLKWESGAMFRLLYGIGKFLGFWNATGVMKLLCLLKRNLENEGYV